MSNPTSNFLAVNDIQLHYLHYANENKKVLVLLHGLTANCRAFEGLISYGLGNNYEILIPDLRGRGLSSHPAFGYSFKNHAEDILGLLKPFKGREIILVGHSFGGLLSAYLCYNHPNNFSKVVFLDAAPEMNKKTPLMLQTALSRLDKKFESKNAYFDYIKQSPYIEEMWDKDMEIYYEADIDTFENGTVEPKSDLAQIIQIATYTSKEPLAQYFSSIKQPALLISADGVYNLDEPILPTHLARKASDLLKKGQLLTSNGNHHTMLYGKFAKEMVNWISEFVG